MTAAPVLCIQDVMDFLRRLAPLELAEPWDNVGLLLGDPAAEVRKIMTCLTLTPASAAEAIQQDVPLIVTHHPVLFKPVQKLTAGTEEGRMLLSLLRAGVAVYSPHTAYDNAASGINDTLCRLLGLENIRPLRQHEEPARCKIVVFVPDGDLAGVSDALFQAGAGIIGPYSQCSFRVAGTGSFFGEEGSHPTLGQKGRREEVAEWRLEVVCPAEQVSTAVQAMRRAHSYEEPAFDVYPLHRLTGRQGAGRVGLLSGPAALEDLAKMIRAAWKARFVQVVGEPSRPVRTVALACGAGGEFLKDAMRLKADVFLTGEMRFHDLLAAEAAGMALVLPGHYATERPGVEELARTLSREFPGLDVWASRSEQDPQRLQASG